MNCKSPFYLSHVTLYAKGWYNRSEDIVSDLIKILKLDDYTPYDKNDVVLILLNAYEKSFNVRLVDLISSIHKYNCWKVGYYTKNAEWVKEYETLPEYDMYTAVIYKILSDLRFLEKKDWIVKFPKYSKEIPRPKNITIPSLIKHFVKTNLAN